MPELLMNAVVFSGNAPFTSFVVQTDCEAKLLPQYRLAVGRQILGRDALDFLLHAP